MFWWLRLSERRGWTSLRLGAAGDTPPRGSSGVEGVRRPDARGVGEGARMPRAPPAAALATPAHPPTPLADWKVDLIVCFDATASPTRAIQVRRLLLPPLRACGPTSAPPKGPRARSPPPPPPPHPTHPLAQRMGRTGRHSQGRVVYVLAAGREQEQYAKIEEVRCARCARRMGGALRSAHVPEPRAPARRPHPTPLTPPRCRPPPPRSPRARCTGGCGTRPPTSSCMRGRRACCPASTTRSAWMWGWSTRRTRCLLCWLVGLLVDGLVG